MAMDIGGIASLGKAASDRFERGYDRIHELQMWRLNTAFQRQEAEKNRDWTSAENVLNRDFSASEAQKARDWQTQMSNTAYQRQIADLKAAGMNPALAFGGKPIEQSPASSAKASMQKLPRSPRAIAQARRAARHGMISAKANLLAEKSDRLREQVEYAEAHQGYLSAKQKYDLLQKMNRDRSRKHV